LEAALKKPTTRTNQTWLTYYIITVEIYEPVTNGFASRTLLAAGVATNGAYRIVHGKTGHGVVAMVVLLVVFPFESGVNLEVLGGGVLHERVQSHRQDERGEHELQEPFEIP